MTRIRGYKYRAYPNKKQHEFFEKTFGCCRFVYNHYLEEKKRIYDEWRGTLSYSEMSRDLSHILKKENVWLCEAGIPHLNEVGGGSVQDIKKGSFHESVSCMQHNESHVHESNRGEKRVICKKRLDEKCRRCNNSYEEDHDHD